jgi:hypothetical protein
MIDGTPKVQTFEAVTSTSIPLSQYKCLAVIWEDGAECFNQPFPSLPSEQQRP